jgi:hypothetical protein
MQTGESHKTTFAAQLDTKQRCVKLKQNQDRCTQGRIAKVLISLTGPPRTDLRSWGGNNQHPAHGYSGHGYPGFALVAQARTIPTGNEVLSIVSRSLMLSLMAVSAAWVFLLKSRSAPQKVVPVQIAAQKLRQAWSANHTTA